MRDLSDAPVTQRHVVQFYNDDDRQLIINVSRFLGTGVRHGGAAVIIATPVHRAAIAEEMRDQGYDPERAMREKRLMLLDAEGTLQQIVAEGQPEWGRFEAVLGRPIRQLRARANGAEVRAYGEMVGLLWNVGRSAMAERIESFWNRLIAAGGLSLFCAYQIDVFGREFQGGVLDEVLCAHDEVVAAQPEMPLAEAVERAMDEVLGSRAPGVKALMKPNARPAWASMSKGAANVLWIRNNLPDCADEILSRARRLSTGRTLTS